MDSVPKGPIVMARDVVRGFAGRSREVPNRVVVLDASNDTLFTAGASVVPPVAKPW